MKKRRAKPYEKINHPSHYGGADNPYEAIKVIDAWGLTFCTGNTVKYIARAGKKSAAPTLEDLKKARWYLDHEIARMEADAAKDRPRRRVRRTRRFLTNFNARSKRAGR